jgi:histidinol-phosphate aminotransferase
MKNIEDYFVPWIRGQKMYISNHLELAWRQMELGRMMSNENPLPPSKKVVEAIRKYGDMANRYPDSGTVVRGKIAEINDLDGPDNVLIGNGSCEVFDMIFRCFIQPGEEVVQHTPCFGIYKLRCNVLGGKLVSVPMINKDGLQFDPDAILAAITDKTRMVVIANPNNPTGNFMSREDFVRIAQTGVPFIVDEAYVEFSGLEKSMVQLTKEYRNVMITRTLSKAYGLAGMRFGYMLGHKDVVGQIAATLLPWNVGTIPMWAALACLEDTEALAERVKFNNSQVKFIEDSLADVPGLFVFHSHSNYILMDGGESGKKGDDMVEFALSKGLIFRPISQMYDNDGYFRITLGSAEQNKKAVEVIKEFYTS